MENSPTAAHRPYFPAKSTIQTIGFLFGRHRLRYTSGYGEEEISRPDRTLNGLRLANFDRIAAAWALLRLNPSNPDTIKAVVPVVAEGLKMEDELVRLECVIALGNAGDKAAGVASQLKKVAENDPSEAVRDAAKEALKAFGS